MKYLFLSFLLLFCIKISFAQYTDVINSRRPGYSDSPYSVGTNVYQLEAGLFYKNISNQLYFDQTNDEAVEFNSKAFGSDIAFRTGQFFERLELSLDLIVQNEDRNYTKPLEYSDSSLGLGRLTIGAKYLVYQPKYKDKSKEIRSWKARHRFDAKRLIPAVGIYAGFNTNLLDDMHKNPDGVSPRFGIYTQNDISNRFIFIMNFIADKMFTNEAENSYILTATYSLSEQWSAFAEHQGFFRKNIPNDYQLGAGTAYLLNKNLQLDVSFRTILDERDDFTYLIGGGMSWRIDRHKDKIIQNKVDNSDSTASEKKGFFGGIAAGVGGMFSGKKSKSKQEDVKEVKVKSRDLAPPVNKKANKARKKQNKQLVKQQKKKEKAERKTDKNQ